MYKLNTPEFNKIKRSQFGRVAIFQQGIVEYIGFNCFIPTSGKCFIKCFNHQTSKVYMNEFSTFIRIEERLSNVMTFARVQPFCRENNINISCFDGFRVCPRNIIEKNRAVYIHKNHFCLIWKTQGVSFIKTIRELKGNLKVVHI